MTRTLTVGAATAILGALLGTVPAQAATPSAADPAAAPCTFTVLPFPGFVMPMPIPMQVQSPNCVPVIPTVTSNG
ncbi:hypothetical protein DZF91_32020 [Actinomadura logoneensis]|uniref:Uncharacterized protein n=1 Tax=Actinomadura logoneensis TaxID=2293572 RepID=A0A372JDX9_9ACTN|nr:hypothetical protein [Actinomadura logoneensis]RFU37598.1 hypothetical protein DZF91_32020 [Actinomadura logoneensis]